MNAASSERYVALDDPGEWPAFGRALDAGAGDHWESHVVVDGLRCAACALSLESHLIRLPGVEGAEVNAASGRARIVWNAALVQPARWFQASSDLGYEMMPELGHADRHGRRRAQRLMLWRWLVATLCMMQVMMYAWPAYVATPEELGAENLLLLRWASWMLTLPVMLFSCGPIFSQSWRELRHGRVGMDLPAALGIVITFVVSSLATFDPTGVFGEEVFFDSLTMFVFFLLSARILETRLRGRAADTIEALMNKLPDTVERRSEDGGFVRIPIRQVVVGDRLRVFPGESFPADGRVIDGETLVDESLMTGESRPVLKATAATVIAGSQNLSAAVEMTVQALGEDTRYGQIVSLIRNAAVARPPMVRQVDRLAMPFLIGVLLCAGLAAIAWWPSDPARAAMTAVAILIVTCPCALSLATPAAMLAAAAALARRGVLLASPGSVESLAAVDTVVFDKTGTLTTGELSLEAVRTGDGWSAEDALRLASLAAAGSLHPVSKALVRADATGIRADDPSWRLIEAREVVGAGMQATISPLADPRRQQRLRLGSARFCGLPDEGAGEDKDADADLPVGGTRPQSGMRVHLTLDDAWVASFELADSLRPKVAESIGTLKRLGIGVQLLSGDRETAVRALADALGLRGRGECSPQDKLATLRQLQSEGRRVAMVGDGLNDAPVLAQASVSIAMGRAVPLARAQADLIVLGDSLEPVARSIEISRRAAAIMKQNLRWAVLYNLVGIPLAAAGAMPAWLAGLGMAGSSLLVMANATRVLGARGAKERMEPGGSREHEEAMQ